MSKDRYADGRAGIDAALVRRLLARQFPRWAGLAVEPVELDGMDNRTYRLGDDMSVRLPTYPAYAPAVEKEHRWLPRLAAQLPLPVPEPLALGEPDQDYPHHWSVRRWIEGDSAESASIRDLTEFAEAVGGFAKALWAADAEGGPAAGAHSFWRGGSPAPYGADTLDAIKELDGRIDTEAATDVWETALSSRWEGAPVWFHGDIAAGNLLVREGALSAVIDFGTSGVGDPACDLVIAWTLFEGESREVFRQTVSLDADTWARARGWAIWKALILLPGAEPNSPDAAFHRGVIEAVIDEHVARNG